MNQSLNQLMQRPARVQVPEEELPSKLPPQNGLVFNVWYNKWSHGTNSRNTQRFLNKYRCDPVRDTGYTRADKYMKQKSLSRNNNALVYHCLYFAKGVCCKGSKCEYFHHIPTNEVSVVYDCFGREKHSDFRDDMSGVGSFQKQNKTLYVSGLQMGSGLPANMSSSAVEQRVKSRFQQFGDIEYVRYLKEKYCFFIKYRFQSCAEFAKEAMANQTLLTEHEMNEKKQLEQDALGIIVKWAKDDPNPHVQNLEKEILRKNALEKMAELFSKNSQQKRFHQMMMMSDDESKVINGLQKNNGNDNKSKKRKLMNSQIEQDQYLFNDSDIKIFQKKALKKRATRPPMQALLAQIYDSD
ncbi:hypothetical protein ACO0QE_002582 [Hanseniaspora vineae]